MLTALFALFVGWLLHFVGLNNLMHDMIGFTDQQYYMTWFCTGLTVWLIKLIRG